MSRIYAWSTAPEGVVSPAGVAASTWCGSSSDLARSAWIIVNRQRTTLSPMQGLADKGDESLQVGVSACGRQVCIGFRKRPADNGQHLGLKLAHFGRTALDTAISPGHIDRLQVGKALE